MTCHMNSPAWPPCTIPVSPPWGTSTRWRTRSPRLRFVYVDIDPIVVALAAGPGLLLAGLGMARLRSPRWWDDTAPPARQDVLTSAGYGGLLLMGLRGLEPGRSPQP